MAIAAIMAPSCACPRLSPVSCQSRVASSRHNITQPMPSAGIPRTTDIATHHAGHPLATLSLI
jgi:hypothetical protein